MSGGYYDILNLGEDVLDAELLNDAYLIGEPNYSPLIYQNSIYQKIISKI